MISTAAALWREAQPRPRQALLDDPQFLGIRPSPTAAGLNDLEPIHLMSVSKDIHTDSQLSGTTLRKAAHTVCLHIR